jgi:hypothetical protein
MTLLTQAEYARRCGVSRQAVGQWKGDGRLVLQGDRVNVELSDAALKRYRRNGLPTTLTDGGPVKRGHTDANTTGQLDTEPMQLPCAEIMRRLTRLDWQQKFDWSDAAQHERATLAARCVGWYAVTSDLRDDGHWGGYQLRTEVIDDGTQLNSNCIVGGFGYEFDVWDVLRACRQMLVESFDGDDDVSVRADLLHWLAHPFAEHERR